MWTAFLFCALAFSESKTLAVQLQLDRAGYSCNVIDGQWGAKSQAALVAYCAAKNVPLPASPEAAADAGLFPAVPALFRRVTVTPADLALVTALPEDPAARAQLPRMGYASLHELFAERGHVSPRALERLNPGTDCDALRVGMTLTVPDFPSSADVMAASDRPPRPGAPPRPQAALVRVSLAHFTISVWDAQNRPLALFPCSIARDKAKLPPQGELKIVTRIAHPNYTYTPDRVPPGQKAARYVWPEGPRNPVGVAWLGLSLPGYGIHGTPRPERIGRAESHGCFRLSNWNAARLYALCRVGTRVLIEP